MPVSPRQDMMPLSRTVLLQLQPIRVPALSGLYLHISCQLFQEEQVQHSEAARQARIKLLRKTVQEVPVPQVWHRHTTAAAIPAGVCHPQKN